MFNFNRCQVYVNFALAVALGERSCQLTPAESVNPSQSTARKALSVAI